MGLRGLLALFLLASPIDGIFAPLSDSRSPGMAVLIRKDGRTVFQRGYGVRDLRTFAQIDARTNFRLASFTKQFTARAIMLLVADGKLRYSDRLTDIFPEFPAYGQAITVRHLLTHTSGLPDYEDLMGTRTDQIQDDEVLVLLERQRAPKFAAGTSWSYSNSGYVVLGLIAAKVSGEPFSEVLRHRIFAPLHMDRTVLYRKGVNTVADRAFGHSKVDGRFVEGDQSSTSATQGDGGIYSNLEDLAKWDAAQSTYDLREATMPVRLNDGSAPKWPLTPDEDNLAPGKPVAYGFGWFLDPFEGRARMWHSGTTTGFRTVIERFTGERLTVIVLANRTDLDVVELALRCAKIER
jgi:CubicO group peptidase (beta-lactamase class C family)